MTAAQVGVVGSGPSGLTAAFRLQQAGYRVRLFEAGDRIGGKLRTSRRDGFIIDEGAGIMPTGYRVLLGVMEDAGLAGALIPAGTTFGFARDGRVHHLDARRLRRDLLGFGLVGGRSKARAAKLLVDVLRARASFDSEDLADAARYDDPGEDAAAYCRRRLDGDLTDYLAEVVIRGLIGTDLDAGLSRVDLLYNVSKFIGADFVALPEGMGWLAEQLGRRFDVALDARVVSVEERGDEVELTWRGADGGERVERLTGCVVAVQAPLAAAILPRLDGWRRAFMERARYTKMVNASVALTRPPAERSMYLQVPRSVHPGLIGIEFEHNKAPGRAPAGKGLVALFSGASWADELIDEDDDLVAKRLLDAADQVVPGLSASVEFATVFRWDPMVLVSRPGYWRELQQFHQLARANDRLVQLAGDWFCCSNLNSAAAAGQRAARDLTAALGGRAARAQGRTSDGGT